MRKLDNSIMLTHPDRIHAVSHRDYVPNADHVEPFPEPSERSHLMCGFQLVVDRVDPQSFQYRARESSDQLQVWSNRKKVDLDAIE